MASVAALLLGLALTWGFGTALVAAVYRVVPPRATPHAAWVFGLGWFVGTFALTLLMRALSAAGVAFGIGSIGGPLVVLTLALGAYAWHGRGIGPGQALRCTFRALAGHGLEGWQKRAWQAICAWLALRFALLLCEVWWRPLYPWDAWTQWSTKARAWFEMHAMVPFVDAGTWLGAGSDAMLWFDAAPHYPATVPLLQTWAAVLVGRWDDTIINLPWWVTGLAFAIALYGALRRIELPALPALAGAAMVLTLPIVNVHIALAGYADLPMACFVTLATIATIQAIRARSIAEAAIALVLLAAMVTVKNPGKAWVAMLLPAFIVAALPRYGLRVAGALFAGAIFALLVAARSGIRLFGYQFALQYAMPWGPLFDAYFSFANWHLLWYLAVATAAIGWRQLLSPPVAPYTMAVACGLLFLFFGFAFTNASAWVEDQSTVNRATLHIAPLVVVWIFVCMRAWLEDAPMRAAPTAAA